MKIIDLLNRIANGEEVPNKIKYRNKIWEYTSTVKGKGYQYYSILYSEWRTLQNLVYLEECLNDEVEIFGEPKKIEKIPLPSFDEFKKMSAEERYVITAKEYDLLNELIDEINNLKEK